MDKNQFITQSHTLDKLFNKLTFPPYRSLLPGSLGGVFLGFPRRKLHYLHHAAQKHHEHVFAPTTSWLFCPGQTVPVVTYFFGNFHNHPEKISRPIDSSSQVHTYHCFSGLLDTKQEMTIFWLNSGSISGLPDLNYQLKPLKFGKVSVFVYCLNNLIRMYCIVGGATRIILLQLILRDDISVNHNIFDIEWQETLFKSKAKFFINLRKKCEKDYCELIFRRLTPNNSLRQISTHFSMC